MEKAQVVWALGFFIITFILFASLQGSGNPGSYTYRYNLSWEKVIKPSTGDDVAWDVAIDSKDNIIVVGFDSAPGNRQWRIMKLDTDGNLIWERTINPTVAHDEARGVAVDHHDNIVVVGYENLPYRKWKVVKFDADGNRIWEASFFEEDEKAWGVTVNSWNEIIVVGDGARDVNYPVEEWKVIKLDFRGSYLWGFITPSWLVDHETKRGVTVDSHDNVIVLDGGWNWRIMKLDTDGNLIWEKTVDPSPRLDEAVGVAVDSNDNIIIVGDSGGGWAIMKLSPDGNVLWKKTIDTAGTAHDVAVDSQDNIIVAGSQSRGFHLRWRIMVFDPWGDILWENVTEPIDEMVWGVAVDSKDNIIVVGGEWRVMKFELMGKCPPVNKCPAASEQKKPGGHAWKDVYGSICCPTTNVNEEAGPICVEDSYCCPTDKPKWCALPKSGNPRCMSEEEMKTDCDVFDVFIVPVQITNGAEYNRVAKEFINHFIEKSPFRECKDKWSRVNFRIVQPKECEFTATAKCFDHCSDCIDLGRRCAATIEKKSRIEFDKFIVLTEGGGERVGGCTGDVPSDGSSSRVYNCDDWWCTPTHEIGHQLGLRHVDCGVECDACLHASPNCPDCNRDIEEKKTFIMDYCGGMERFGAAAYHFLKTGYEGNPPNHAGLARWLKGC